MAAFNFDDSNIHLVYEKSRLLPDETLQLWIDAIRDGLPDTPIRTILDLGCGTGRFTKALSDSFDAEIYGVDPSGKMLSIAIETKQSPRIHFLHGYAESIPLDDDSTDLVFMSHVYHHIQDKNKAFAEMKRVLSKNKFLCIRHTTLEELDTFIYPDFFPSAKKIDMEHLPSKNELSARAESTGFTLTKFQVIHQLFAKSRMEYYQKISLRGTSDLTAISDKEFHEGLQALKEFCYANEPEKPVHENVGLFIFRSV